DSHLHARLLEVRPIGRMRPGNLSKGDGLALIGGHGLHSRGQNQFAYCWRHNSSTAAFHEITLPWIRSPTPWLPTRSNARRSRASGARPRLPCLCLGLSPISSCFSPNRARRATSIGTAPTCTLLPRRCSSVR